MSEYAKDSGPTVAQVEMFVAASRRRSSRIRNVTIVLLLSLLGIGIFLTLQAERRRNLAQEREKQVQQQEEQLRQQQETLRRQAEKQEHLTKAASLVASGSYKAGRGRFTAALADYDSALKVDPDNPGALAYKGYLELRMGQGEPAEELLRKAVQGDPSTPWGHYNFALALWNNGKEADAINEVHEVLRLDPSFKSTIAGDPQFNKFRSSPEFRQLMATN